MAQKKKAAAKRAPRQTEEDTKASSGANALTGALYHGGRMYDHRKASDQKAFAALAEKEGGLAPREVTDPAKRKDAHKEALQRMADQGVLKGYGTKATAKSKKAEGEHDENYPVSLTEQQALDQKSEDEDDEG